MSIFEQFSNSVRFLKQSARGDITVNFAMLSNNAKPITFNRELCEARDFEKVLLQSMMGQFTMPQIVNMKLSAQWLGEDDSQSDIDDLDLIVGYRDSRETIYHMIANGGYPLGSIARRGAGDIFISEIVYGGYRVLYAPHIIDHRVSIYCYDELFGMYDFIGEFIYE